MNIFYLNSNPLLAAQEMCDAHVVKMPLEYTQMLCTFVRELRGEHAARYLYKSTHRNHPCNVWLRDTVCALDWFVPHALAAFTEFQFRRGKEHASATVFAKALMTIEGCGSRFYDWTMCHTPPPQCMPDVCKVSGDTVAAYRNYYRTHKKHLHFWTKRDKPSWI